MSKSSCKTRSSSKTRHDDEHSDSENSNDNHSADSTVAMGRKRHISQVKSKVVKVKTDHDRTKRRKTRKNSEEDRVIDESGLEAVRFNEDDNLVEFAVRDEEKDCFPSDEEGDQSADSETEDGEIASGDEGDGRDNSVNDTDEPGEPGSPQPETSRRVVKKATRRPSQMQKQLSEMSTTLMYMQEMMIENGLFGKKEKVE